LKIFEEVENRWLAKWLKWPSACLANVRPWVQTPMLKKKKGENKKGQCLFAPKYFSV
jgi:hypothetical protein